MPPGSLRHEEQRGALAERDAGAVRAHRVRDARRDTAWSAAKPLAVRPQSESAAPAIDRVADAEPRAASAPRRARARPTSTRSRACRRAPRVPSSSARKPASAAELELVVVEGRRERLRRDVVRDRRLRVADARRARADDDADARRRRAARSPRAPAPRSAGAPRARARCCGTRSGRARAGTAGQRLAHLAHPELAPGREIGAPREARLVAGREPAPGLGGARPERAHHPERRQPAGRALAPSGYDTGRTRGGLPWRSPYAERRSSSTSRARSSSPTARRMREKPTLLLLHGGPGFDHSSFKPAFSELADVAQVVYLDHRGNGRSERPRRPARWNLARVGRRRARVLRGARHRAAGRARAELRRHGRDGVRDAAPRSPGQADPLEHHREDAPRPRDPHVRAARRARGARRPRAATGRSRARTRCPTTRGSASRSTRARRAIPTPTAARSGTSTSCSASAAARTAASTCSPDLAKVRCPTLVLGGEDDPITPDRRRGRHRGRDSRAPRALRALRGLPARRLPRRSARRVRGDPALPRGARLETNEGGGSSSDPPPRVRGRRSVTLEGRRRRDRRRVGHEREGLVESLLADQRVGVRRSPRTAAPALHRGEPALRGAFSTWGTAALTATWVSFFWSASVAKLGAATSSAPRAAKVARRFILSSSPHELSRLGSHP